jgi:hypothetical protein
MPEFSKRVNIEVFKDEPQSYEQFAYPWEDADAADIQRRYDHYLEHFQPFRWHAKAANNKILSDGESYHNLADLEETLDLFAGDDTTVYYAHMFGEDRGDHWLRYGRTDLINQKGLGDTVIVGPEAFAKEDGSVLCWKGVNYVPQADVDDSPEQAES